MSRTNNKNNKNNKYGGEYQNSCDNGKEHINTIQTYPKIPIDYYYDVRTINYNQELLIPQIIEQKQGEYSKIDVTKAFEIYNWFVKQYYDVIKIYNDFYDGYNKITQSAKIGNINIFDDAKSFVKIEKLGEYILFHKIDYPYGEVISHAEMVELLNKMNDNIKDIKNFISEIHKIMTEKLIIEDPAKTIDIIMRDIEEQRQVWKKAIYMQIPMSGGNKLSESSTQVDNIIEKIKILDELFKDPYKINNMLKIFKEQKIKKTVEKIKENHKYHKMIDDENKKTEKERKYKYHNYEIIEFPELEVLDLKIDYKYFENEKDNTDISKLNEILDQKLSLMNTANDYLDVEKNFLDQNYKNSQKTDYEKNDFTFLGKSDMIGDKQILLEYINKKEELKQYANDMKLHDELMRLYKEGTNFIDEHNNKINAEIKIYQDIKSENDGLVNQIKENFKNQTGSVIQNIIKNLNKFLAQMPDVYFLKSADGQKKSIFIQYFDMKKNEYEYNYDSDDIIAKLIVNPKKIEPFSVKEKIELIKSKLTPQAGNEMSAKISRDLGQLNSLKTTYTSKIGPLQQKSNEGANNIQKLNKNIIEYNGNLEIILLQNEEMRRLSEIATINMPAKYMEWYKTKYKPKYDEYAKSNLSRNPNPTKFSQEIKSQLESLKEEIKNKQELKFSVLDQQNKNKINNIKTTIYTDGPELNEKLFNTIGEMKKISKSVNLVFDFVTDDELQKFNANNKNIINLQNTDFYKMKGGDYELYLKNMELIQHTYIFFQKIDEYIDKYTEALKLNREAIYRKFYEYIVCNELLQSQPKFNPILYLSYNDMEEYKQKVAIYKNPYLSSITEKIIKLCEKIENYFPDKDTSFLYIDPIKATFMDLLLLLHLVSIL